MSGWWGVVFWGDLGGGLGRGWFSAVPGAVCGCLSVAPAGLALSLGRVLRVTFTHIILYVLHNSTVSLLYLIESKGFPLLGLFMFASISCGCLIKLEERNVAILAQDY